MSRPDLHRHLDTYLSVREALGFQMRVERTLLRDLIHFLEHARASGRSGLSWPWIGRVPPRPSGASVALPSA